MATGIILMVQDGRVTNKMCQIFSKIRSTSKRIACKIGSQVVLNNTRTSSFPYLLYRKYDSNKSVKYPAHLIYLGGKRSKIGPQSEG